MLGEGARTDADARRYYHAYAHSIAAIAKAYPKEMPGDDLSSDSRPGISVKLSALDPRYEVQKSEALKTRLAAAADPAGTVGRRRQHQYGDRRRGGRPA